MTRTDETVAVLDVQTIKEDGKMPPLYAARKQVYPKRVMGFFRRLKWAALVVLLGIYYITPWLRWDRGPGVPDQAILIDMAHERAYFFFVEIWAQEVYYLTAVLIMAAIGLFLVTSIGGRVWCGYACPQTVWTDLYMWVERKVEGDRNSRMKLDKGPLTGGKVVKKTAKHGIWLLIALATGGAWIFYFNDAPTVIREIFSGQASMTVYFFIGLFTFTTYTLAGWAREQVCTYMCPWPRFQAAMMDENTFVVTYEGWRGEPRGKLKKGAPAGGQGDCVDCNQCVAVCPTGIDIRDGLQLECIGCGLCVDACNTVMAKIDRPPNLITLDSISNQERRSEGKAAVLRILRPRTLIYAAILFLVAAGMVGTLLTRPNLHANLLQDRRPLFVPLANGDIRNGYTVKVSNRRQTGRTVSMTIEGVAGATMTVIGATEKNVKTAFLQVELDAVSTYRVFVTAPASSLKAETAAIVFRFVDTVTGKSRTYETLFRGPRK